MLEAAAADEEDGSEQSSAEDGSLVVCYFENTLKPLTEIILLS